MTNNNQTTTTTTMKYHCNHCEVEFREPRDENGLDTCPECQTTNIEQTGL